jgi:hypothetical protein
MEKKYIVRGDTLTTSERDVKMVQNHAVKDHCTIRHLHEFINTFCSAQQ